MVTEHLNLKRKPKHVLVLVWKVIFYIDLNFRICMLMLLQYIKWIKWIKFAQFQCHCPLHDPSPKALTSDMLLRHHNWYIQKDMSLVHSEFPTAIETLIVHCYKAVLPWGSESCRLSTRPREGSTRSLRKIFWWPAVGIIRINAASWCGVYSRAAFIDISALQCDVFLRAAFNRIKVSK